MTVSLLAQARLFRAGIAGGVQSGRRCCCTYCWMISSGAPPQDAAKYDGDHRCSRWVRRLNCRRSRRLDTPLRLFTSREICTVGGYSTSRCTWSSSPLNSVRTAPKSVQTLANTGCIAVRCSSVNTPRRYFVTKTKCTRRADTHDLPRRISPRSVIDQLYDSGVSLARYRYRIYPTPGQMMMLARTFGCARVVFNDAIRTRQDAHAAGEKISDPEVQRRVITLAKTTPERSWLGEVASVALVQACQDARRAYRNWFDSLSGKRRGRKVGHPRFRCRKDNRQSIRLTRNGFSLRPNGRLYVAKIGDLAVEWSRDLPSVPSSVTVIREADGRYYASFVVERTDEPMPSTTSDVGVDLGLEHLAVTSDGEVIANPRHLRRKARRLAHAQRVLARKRRRSANRTKAVRRVAVHHRKVRESRLDAHHKLALRLVRDNQAVYVEDLAVAGLARTRLAKAVHDAGWSTLVRLIEEKATQYGRTVVKISRWFPSSRLCSNCGHNDGPKPLNVRYWTCPECGAGHDRDRNAARNILVEGRRVAAGLAETENACGATVRPGLVPAGCSEAGTRRGAA